MRLKSTHLTLNERCLIFGLKSSNFSLRRIARQLSVNVSTVSRELSRNSDSCGNYSPSIAESCYRRRRKNFMIARGLTSDVRAKIISGLIKYFSPVQISGSLKKEGSSISHETIYKFIWQDKRDGGRLFERLRRKGKKYNKRGSVNAGRGLIPNRVDISERDPIVETKSRVGDWEADTIIGADHKGAIVSLVDRKTKFALFKLVPDKTMESVTKAILNMMKPIKDKVLTITFDNGKEFASHAVIAKELDTKCYFARPYHSWERGLNEHTNGLMRQFVPKKTDFTTLRDEDVATYQDLINNRPRKVLDFNTPTEMFLNPDTVAFRT